MSLFCWKYTETLTFLVKFIGQWISNGDGRGIARDIKKNIFIIKSWQKIVTKLGPFFTFQLFKLSKLCHHFLSNFENENNYFLISLTMPCPLPSGIHWPINFTKKKMFLYIFKQQKVQNWEGSQKNWSLFSFFKIHKKTSFLGPNWLVNEFWTAMGGK